MLPLSFPSAGPPIRSIPGDPWPNEDTLDARRPQTATRWSSFNTPACRRKVPSHFAIEVAYPVWRGRSLSFRDVCREIFGSTATPMARLMSFQPPFSLDGS
jgi:hypothetical protein